MTLTIPALAHVGSFLHRQASQTYETQPVGERQGAGKTSAVYSPRLRPVVAAQLAIASGSESSGFERGQTRQKDSRLALRGGSSSSAGPSKQIFARSYPQDFIRLGV